MPETNSDSAKSSAPKPAARKPAVAAKPAGAAKPAVAKPAALKPTSKAAAKAATPKPADAEPVAPVSVEGENPLHKKLRLRPEDKGLVIAPPQDDDNPLLPLPSSFVVLSRPAELASHKGPFDYIQVFARDRAGLVESFPLLIERLAPGGGLWISWMKLSSKHGGGGQTSDLNEDVVRRIGLSRGLVDINLVVLDRDWSALRLVRRKH